MNAGVEINPQRARRIILAQSKRANVGHIGCSLSVVDILVALYGSVLKIADPADPDRDRFIMSMGHAALALYSVLHLRGWLTERELSSFCADGSALGVHPEHVVRGIDFSTGSLGLGLSFGAGAALAARLRGSRRRVFVLLSDAECNEGSTWEGIMFAAHHRLGNLLAIVDVNGQQAFGYTREVLNLSSLADRWRRFGWETVEVDGHDIAALVAGAARRGGAGRPRVLLAHTVFGKGVSFMESQIKWHYSPMSDYEYRQALLEIGAEP